MLTNWIGYQDTRLFLEIMDKYNENSGCGGGGGLDPADHYRPGNGGDQIRAGII